MAAYARCQEDEHGAKLFAFSPHDVGHDLIEQHHIAFHQVFECLLETVHFGGNRGLYVSNGKSHVVGL